MNLGFFGSGAKFMEEMQLPRRFVIHDEAGKKFRK